MRASLATWISDTDALRHQEQFRIPQQSVNLAYLHVRRDDFYLALVGQFFAQMREGGAAPEDWARLGNAFHQVSRADKESDLAEIGIGIDETRLFAAGAFYLGGFPASALLTIRERRFKAANRIQRACFELLARPLTIRSPVVGALLTALRTGNLQTVARTEEIVARYATAALRIGPETWIPTQLFLCLLRRFRETNIRAVLPEGGSDFWTPLVSSLLDQRPPAWDFFPSQIEAIRAGLLDRSETFSLQMPTGAGKTALCETLLFRHLRTRPEAAAVVLVPYRSLASELRGTLVRRLNGMGVPAGFAYGGTVPSGDDLRELDMIQALVATPETLSGLLSANADFLRRISLVICDEGHLLDSGTRGVGLELLLARVRARTNGAPRFIFLSAIVPNIEEINAWLGGQPDSVVRSTYRPAVAQFAVLRASARTASAPLFLEMNPHEATPIRYSIERFLERTDFQWRNVETGRLNTFAFTSVKTRAIATARKALNMGPVAVFAAHKRGNQGAIGLTNELLNQLERGLPLPVPIDFAAAAAVEATSEYLRLEYGPNWIGTRALAAGAVLHHGDLPQETREVVESLLRRKEAHFVVCTSTLAEGVNLPIRTLVLYSVQRRTPAGRPEPLLARDIKNLVGRAGRPGATRNGLVICANEDQWPIVAPVARQEAGEPVTGALRKLVERIQSFLAVSNITVTNEWLERSVGIHGLIDGIDATLVDLAAEEIGQERLAELAVEVADQTFAATQASAASRELIHDVFRLRATRIVALREAGRLGWIRETGARVRMIDTVETNLLPRREHWNDITDPTDPHLVNTMLEWAWTQRDVRAAAIERFGLDDPARIDSLRLPFTNAVALWLGGSTLGEIAQRSNLDVDDMISVHAGVIAYVLQTVVEQGVALLGKLLEAQGVEISSAVMRFPEHLRFGAPTAASRILSSGGLRHRRAAVLLGSTPRLSRFASDDPQLAVFSEAQAMLTTDRAGWQDVFGRLVFANTLHDVEAVTRQPSGN